VPHKFDTRQDRMKLVIRVFGMRPERRILDRKPGIEKARRSA
jgi:hypothetical protein